MSKKVDLYPERNETNSSCVIAGDFIFISHQRGGQHSNDFAIQLEGCFDNLGVTLAAAGANLDDVVQINLLLKNTIDFPTAQSVFREYFLNGFPARSTIITDFIAPKQLCQIDAIAYKKQNSYH